MITHDPMCPGLHLTVSAEYPCACCHALARARALACAEVRERIAEAIEAKADDLDWDGAAATKGELEAVRDYAATVLHEAAAIARETSE